MLEDASEVAFRLVRLPESARVEEIRRLRKIAVDYPGQQGYVEEVLKTAAEYLEQLEKKPS